MMLRMTSLRRSSPVTPQKRFRCFTVHNQHEPFVDGYTLNNAVAVSPPEARERLTAMRVGDLLTVCYFHDCVIWERTT